MSITLPTMCSDPKVSPATNAAATTTTTTTTTTTSMNLDLDDEENSVTTNVQSSSIQYYGPKVSPPITLLQEICSRNGLTPEYQLLSTEGSVHEPTFKIAVSVGDICTSASGQSKKKARHAAARDAIEKLRREKPDLNYDGINFDSIAPLGELTASTYSIGVNETNPVGKLQEICMKMRVNPPDYETCDEKGLAHERIFYLSCKIESLNLITMGEGRSKKLAKREAAASMLEKLENSDLYDKTSNSKATDQGGNSLNIDCDDTTHFVSSRKQVTELANRLDYNVKDLWADVEMIELNNVDEDFFYETFLNTVEKIGHPQYHYWDDTHCLLQVCDENNKVVLTSAGVGHDNVSAMKECVLNAYKIMMTHLNPLTGVNPNLNHKIAGSQSIIDRSNQTQD